MDQSARGTPQSALADATGDEPAIAHADHICARIALHGLLEVEPGRQETGKQLPTRDGGRAGVPFHVAVDAAGIVALHHGLHRFATRDDGVLVRQTVGRDHAVLDQAEERLVRLGRDDLLFHRHEHLHFAARLLTLRRHGIVRIAIKVRIRRADHRRVERLHQAARLVANAVGHHGAAAQRRLSVL